jgi:pyrimidine-nucleoside phosphorylase
MLVTEVIRKKRDGRKLDADEIKAVIAGYTKGEIPDYQMSALLMAVFLRGLDNEELSAWTQAMLHSGRVIDLSHIKAKKVDKHSTGGVGDKISIPLAPVVASLGVDVPMISGRGLGHTGGTLDKLESIPNFDVRLSPERFVEAIEKVGVAMIGQTEDLAPADKKIYALRDSTGTVESIPLISASIMSKKLCEGIQGLVLDVKVGSGAFMKTVKQAEALAKTMVGIGKSAGVRTVAVLTSMDEPLGWAVGNALEIEESIEILKGTGPKDTTALVEELGAWMLVLGGVALTKEEGKTMVRKAIKDGSGLRKFKEMVGFQGGDALVAEDLSRLPMAKYQHDFCATRKGYVSKIECEKVGLALCALGGGRKKKEDKIDPSVGFRVQKKMGSHCEEGEPLMTIYYNDEERLKECLALLRQSYVIGEKKPRKKPLIIRVIN